VEPYAIKIKFPCHGLTGISGVKYVLIVVAFIDRITVSSREICEFGAHPDNDKFIELIKEDQS